MLKVDVQVNNDKTVAKSFPKSMAAWIPAGTTTTTTTESSERFDDKDSDKGTEVAEDIFDSDESTLELPGVWMHSTWVKQSLLAKRLKVEAAIR